MSQANTPSALTTVLSLIDQIPYIMIIGQGAFMLIALWCCYSAFLDAACMSNKGQKYFSSKQQPTIGSVIGKVLLAALLFVTADGLFTIGVITSIFDDGSYTSNSLITLQSYSSTVTNYEARAGLTLITLAAQVVGIFAVLHGIRIWIQIADGVSQHTIGRGFAFIFFGVCCFQIRFMHQLLTGALGWDFAQIFAM